MKSSTIIFQISLYFQNTLPVGSSSILLAFKVKNCFRIYFKAQQDVQSYQKKIRSFGQNFVPRFFLHHFTKI